MSVSKTNNIMHRLLTIVFVLNYFIVYGQYNFSFERPFELQMNAPGNWSVYSVRGELCNNSTYSSDGEKCLCIAKKEENSNDKLYFFTQMIVNNNLTVIKNEVLFKFDLKSNFEKTDSLKVVIKTFENDFTIINESTEYLIPSELADWSEYQIKQNVSSEKIMNIFFEFSYLGSSDKVEMDNLRLFIDGKAYNNREIEDDSEVIELLTEYCHPIKNFDIESVNISDYIDGIKIVGLGENSHGCQEIQVLRNNIVQHLVKTKNYKNIILEDNYFRTHFLNIALHSKDTNEILPAIERLQFWINKHQEMYKLLRDIRLYDNVKDVNIFGCDFFLNKAFIKYMTTGNRNTTDQIERFNSYFSDMDFYAIFSNDNAGKDWHQEKEMFCSLYPNESLTKFENEMAYKTFDFSLKKFSKNNTKLRDEGLFELTDEIVEHKGKSIILAHNGHIGYFMGNHLNEKYEKKYITIGFLFYEGRYLGKNADVVEEYSFKAIGDTYESLFNQVPYDVFFVDLKQLKENKKLMKKISPRGFYQFGALSHNACKSFDVINLEEKFDYIIFIKKISPTQF